MKKILPGLLLTVELLLCLFTMGLIYVWTGPVFFMVMFVIVWGLLALLYYRWKKQKAKGNLAGCKQTLISIHILLWVPVVAAIVVYILMVFSMLFSIL